MKKVYLSIALMLSMAVTYGADRIIDNFEAGTSVFNTKSATMPASVVDNPSKTGINTSNKVLKVTAHALWDESMAVFAKPVFNFYTHPILSLKVYATDSIGIIGRIDNKDSWKQYVIFNEFPLNAIKNFNIGGTDIGTWVEFQVDLGYWDQSDYSKLLIAASDTSHINTFYIDDVKFIERSPVFSNSSEVSLFYEPVTTIKWVGDWVGLVAPGNTGYPILHNVTYGATDSVRFSPNGYMAWPNDTITGSSGGAGYIFAGTGSKNSTMTFTIPTIGCSNLNLKFDMAIIRTGAPSGKAPVVEAKVGSGSWGTLTLSNVPTVDSTWQTVTAPIAGTGATTSIRITNTTPEADTCNFWIDDIKILGTTTQATSATVTATGDLDTVSVGGTLQLIFTPDANATLKYGYWTVNDTSLAEISMAGLLTGKKAGTVTVTCTAVDGSNISDNIDIVVADVVVLATSIDVTAPSDSVQVGSYLALTATVNPGNVTDNTVTWSIDADAITNGIASIIATTGQLRGKKVGTVTVTATANDGSGVTGTKTITVVTSTGVNDIYSDQSISIYPNPVYDILKISGTGVNSIKIVNMVGQVLKSVTDNNITSVNLEGLKEGIYFVRINNTGVYKIVKR